MVFKNNTEQGELTVKGLKQITWDELRAHNTRKSCWVVIDGNVYDISNWLHKHPGGDVVILSMSSEDCTDIFNAYHPPYVRARMLELHKIGIIVDYSVSKMVKEFREIAKTVERSKLMNTNPIFYLKLSIWYVFLISTVLLSILYGGESVWISSVLSGVFMALFFQQVAFIGHDLGHTAVTHSRKNDSVLGIFIGNMLTGISMGWWKATHNAHHVATNILASDPDIQHFPFFAISAEHFCQFLSTYHEKMFSFIGLARIAVPMQAYLYYLIMSVARLNLYIQSYVFLLHGDEFRERRIKSARNIELTGLLVFATWLTCLMAQIPTATGRILFFVISHTLAGLLHVQITLSHFAMPVFITPSATGSFVEHQIKTSMDIDCHQSLDWFHGGLQFQVVHHLFPRVPRHNLRGLRAVVQTFALKYGLAYECYSFVQANKLMINHLASVAGESRIHILDDIMNLRG